MGREDRRKSGLTDIPDMSKAQQQGKMVLVAIATVSPLIGLAIAFGLWKMSCGAKCTAKMTYLASEELHWVCLAAWVFARTIALVNTLPMFYKSGIMGVTAGNLRANMMIYKLANRESDDEPYVILEEDGCVGQYNRANRSLTHMIENLGGFMIAFPIAAYLLPFVTLVLTIMFSLGRVVHQVGYAGGYGKHAPGFMLATLASEGIVGLSLLAGLNGLGVF
jgi:hypothetical protein